MAAGLGNLLSLWILTGFIILLVFACKQVLLIDLLSDID